MESFYSKFHNLNRPNTLLVTMTVEADDGDEDDQANKEAKKESENKERAVSCLDLRFLNQYN